MNVTRKLSNILSPNCLVLFTRMQNSSKEFQLYSSIFSKYNSQNTYHCDRCILLFSGSISRTSQVAAE